jgi:hypothetical protein
MEEFGYCTFVTYLQLIKCMKVPIFTNPSRCSSSLQYLSIRASTKIYSCTEEEKRTQHFIPIINIFQIEAEVFWVVIPCSFAIDFTLKREAARSLYRNTTRHHNPEDLDLKLHRLENLKSRIRFEIIDLCVVYVDLISSVHNG